MNTRLPRRGASQQLEGQSEQFFRRHVPRAWTIETPTNDFGVDLRLGVVDENHVTGKELVIQLKASSKASTREFETVRLAVTTYNFLSNHLNVAMLVKYVEPEQEAYWVLIKDVSPPTQAQKTFTVRLPKSNKLSKLLESEWEALRNQIQRVHNLKLGAARQHCGNT